MTTPYIEEKVEELAGEIWRAIKEDFEKEGIILPLSWKGVGMAYGGYARASRLLQDTLTEVDRRARGEEQKRTLKDAIEWKEKGFELSTFIDKLRTYPIADSFTNLTPNQ